MNPRVLVFDEDPMILTAHQRDHRATCQSGIDSGGMAALETIMTSGPIADHEMARRGDGRWEKLYPGFAAELVQRLTVAGPGTQSGCNVVISPGECLASSGTSLSSEQMARSRSFAAPGQVAEPLHKMRAFGPATSQP